jgi:hypothetical protein
MDNAGGYAALIVVVTLLTTAIAALWIPGPWFWVLGLGAGGLTAFIGYRLM